MVPQKSCLLSPLDQLMPPTYTRVFLTFTTSEHGPAIAALKSGLHSTCQQIPYLMGNVRPTAGRKGFLEISWSDDSSSPNLLELKPSDQIPTYSELKAQGMPVHYLRGEISPVSPWIDISSPKTAAPVLAASYTKLDGGLVFCIAVHHLVMDGTGVGELIRLLAENVISVQQQPESQVAAMTGQATLSDIIPDEPLHRLDLLKDALRKELTDSDKHATNLDELFKKHVEYSLEAPKTSNSVPKSGLTSKIFRFSAQNLNAAKIALAAHLDSKILTANTILCSILWSCISRVRLDRVRGQASPSDQERYKYSKLGFAINGRRRIGDAFATGKRYLGNVNLFGIVHLKMDTLVNNNTNLPSSAGTGQIPLPQSFTEIVQAIAAAIARVDATFVSEVISLAEQVPNVRALLPGWSSWNGPDLTITSWASLGTYSVDFGPALGKPDFFRVPYAQADGLCIALPRKEERQPEGTCRDTASEEGNAGSRPAPLKPTLGDIEVVVMLRQDDMQVLERDEIWRTWTDSF